MRHKYAMSGIVLARSPLAEAGLLVTCLTSELGLIRARAEGVRRSGAKLAHALQTLRTADLMLVRGKEGWRVTGAVLTEDGFTPLQSEARARAARVSGLLLRMIQGESHDARLHALIAEFLTALANVPDGEAVEMLAVLRILSEVGVDAGELPPVGYGPDAIAHATENKKDLIARINRGITASNL